MEFDLSTIVADALARGSSYALIGTGFTLVWGVLRCINLAYGASILLALFVAIWAEQRFAISPVLLAPVTIFVTVVSGIYVELLCFAPHARRGAMNAMTAMAASFAIWMQLEEIATMLVPRHANSFPALFESAGGGLRTEYLIALASAAGFAISFWLLLHRTRLGLAIRATISNRHAASCAGIPVARISMVSFALASVLGGIAGYLICSMEGRVTPMFAMWITLKGLIAAMIGGLGSLQGAICGGLILGIFESFGQTLLGPQVRDLSAYLLLIALLRLYPEGVSGFWGTVRDKQSRT